MSSEAASPFRFWSFFFSPQGRVSRKAIWYFVLPLRLILFGAGLYAKELFRQVRSPTEILGSPFFLLNAATGLVGLITLWPVFVLLVKRLHDVGRNGWLALVVFYPLIYAISTTVFLFVTHKPLPPAIPLPLRYVMTGLSYGSLVLAGVLAVVPGNRGMNRFGASFNGETRDVEAHF